MALRFEVSLNGQRHCVAGLDRPGNLSLTIQSLREDATPVGDENEVFAEASTDDGEAWWWPIGRIAAGDEIVVRELPTGAFDPPRVMEPPEDE